MGKGTRSQSERDAITVEIGYALVSAVLLAAVVLAVTAGPAALWTLPPAVDGPLLVTGPLMAGVVAVTRVVYVLRQYARHQPARPDGD
ncbi:MULTISPECIES: DUF6332 family protein [unclassified Streptomyces]|uniref:DUF6332 family protein n=1 Tax=unclassified Streptomyces TaxID=2593676 RepID=UPI002DDA924B|nr:MULTISPECIES: DUF6332 family protein [unclassified Streptomyces]WSA96015.1 DUF6332 family protein [Streptomyces sp. NBC_01795]WSB80430.1 DUF6332 family protein [Streptomyces sp. NBC_01775]WSS11364.1 DUF6332 family protein [Streptomyces sp. NBC_01186]WSS40074.1 DUF6332 family protein [Streptomyces sp. NBC_01187]